jgi:hypothetical protein
MNEYLGIKKLGKSKRRRHQKEEEIGYNVI